MKIHLKRCRTCGALGVGPNAVKLFPLDDLFYCGPDFKKALDWATNREAVTQGIGGMVNFLKDSKKIYAVKQETPKNWRAYIEEHSGMAAEALVMGDRRTFVYYFSRALWAWELSREN